tara:strand:- start:448 stop:1185 length:738 start_codon:yes stop_codon:yes gene_type:complete
MAIAAKVSSAELTAQVTDRFVGRSFEARLIDASGTSYEPGITNDATFLGFEVPIGTGGYQRQVISYTSSDVSAYTDDGVALTTRATVFAHNGGATTIDFSHAALVWSTGNALTLSAVGTAPSAAVNGTYTNIPVDTTSGSGVGLTVNLTVTNSGASSSDYAVSIVNAGYNYAAADTITFLEGTLAGLGIVSAGAGNLALGVATINAPSNAGDVVSIAQTPSAVVLSGGNEAVFYWNLKQFGFFST